MNSWRVTKYDPARRDRKGRFRDMVWTSISDIGRPFESGVLGPAEYLAIEDAYLAAVRAFLRAAGDHPLSVIGLEFYGPPRLQSALEVVKRPVLQEGEAFSGVQVDAIVRLVLREELWCELRHADAFRVRFGWDYSMYVSSADPSVRAIAEVEARGLFVEPIEAFP